jgi:adenine-specific DNA-methyltransferase
VKERAIICDDKDAPNHILIEGDNLEALTALSYTHKGKIDVIYIDPPYNTGKEDEFKYNDKFVDSNDGYRHSKWLSFMSKRLRIAKQLIKDTGVIFISIDDNEIAQLKCICDEIFNTFTDKTRTNCLGILVWDLGTGTQAGHFTRSHEYILTYAINKDYVKNFSGGEGVIDHSALKKISKKNPPVRYLFKAGTTFAAKDGFELNDEWGNSEKTKLLSGRMVADNGKLKYDVELEAGFAMISQMKTWFKGEYTIDSKGQHVTDFYFNSSGVLHYKKDRSIINPPSVIKECGSTKTGSTELYNILCKSESFGYPKPSELIKFLLSLQNSNITILDFFAGSGTTLHAAMKLNSEDDGHRQCILVTNNENNICEEVTYVRNKKVIEGYTTPRGEEVAGLKNNNLRYYKTDFISRDKTPRNMRALVNASTDLLCIKNDIYAEALFASKKLNAKIARYFDDGKTRMLVIYDERAIAAIAELIKTLPAEPKIKVYTFSPSRYAFDDEFAEVADRVDLCALPAAIYDAYLHVLPKRRPKYLPEALAEMEPETKAEPQQTEMDFDDEEGGNK